MPFQSEAQRRLLWAKHPDIAKRWAHEHPNSNKGLPVHKKKGKHVSSNNKGLFGSKLPQMAANVTTKGEKSAKEQTRNMELAKAMLRSKRR